MPGDKKKKDKDKKDKKKVDKSPSKSKKQKKRPLNGLDLLTEACVYVEEQERYQSRQKQEENRPGRHSARTRAILNAWYEANMDKNGRAYLSEEEKVRLAHICNLKPKQVATWVNNRRNR
ncbi:hypothetical protein PTSG_07793 [Salpingoeca rosetta]|uniref:Homeobox domain-containing protein n=1 Tax=Salpingoeca rosetta (strain ATCC 50818 / BSB-021) TaxID=946362 RepID=F2UGC4_SALR5|nr:uncharacterized protein PTSG_07793 [Salpingoeca rosetta]EGD75674.1 hypothetical protein PTSG_07793 [Salpingoeca rosetta]|eukprot:XP_004991595.1 hypothetical protein PTSG_07793 [Salpingoeca rosetta]